MIYLCGIIITAAFLYSVIFAFLCVKLIEKEREATRKERSELLTRIQHPQMVMIPDMDKDLEVAEPTPDEYGMVGQIMDFPSQEQSDARIAAFTREVGLDDDE